MITAAQLRAAGVFVPPHVPDHEMVEAIHFHKAGSVRPLEEIATAMQAQSRQIAALTKLVTPLVTRGLSRDEQARKAGVHRSTLCRREARERLQLLANPSRAHRRRKAA